MKLNRENMAVVCAGYLKLYCTDNPTCKDCPFNRGKDGCALVAVPEHWGVDSLEE